MQIPILFEDSELLVLDKPAGITVNRSDTTKDEETVQDFTESHLGLNKISEKERFEQATVDANGYKNAFFDRGGIVHRLDKETSGILLVAKTPEAFLNLQKQFHDRLVKKTYLALVHGEIVPATGEIAIPVDRLPWNRKRFGVVPGGRASLTKYMVIKTLFYPKTKERLSIVQLYPETGRTHQIRVHMKYLNRPIFADFLYAGRKTAREDRKVLDRVFLHAEKISFLHPATGKKIELSSTLPSELQGFLANLTEE